MIQIYLWLLSRTNRMVPTEWFSVIVAAGTETEAREIANENARAEGYVWTDPDLVSGKRLGVADEDVYGIILFSSDDQKV